MQSTVSAALGAMQMRGTDVQQSGLFSYVPPEDRIPADHTLRVVQALLGEARSSMSRDFDRVYADGGRASIPPERLVRALTLQILYSIRSERLLCEQLNYNLLFRWLVGVRRGPPLFKLAICSGGTSPVDASRCSSGRLTERCSGRRGHLR